MDLKLVLYTGTNCPRCPGAREVVREVAKEVGWTEGKEFVEKNIDKQDNMIEALTFQIASVPSVLINGEAVFNGAVPTREQLMEEIKKVL